MYRVYDSYGNLVRGGFTSYQIALEFKYIYGNPSWYIL